MQNFRRADSVVGCATASSDHEKRWAADGYLTSGPTSEPEIIGVFDDKAECEKAAKE